MTADDSSSKNWRKWIIISLITTIWHLALFWLQPRWRSPVTPPPVEVQQIDPKKLEAIRDRWKRLRDQDKPLLLDKDKTKPGEKEASPDARYMSDKNIRVEKEQRARNTQVIPKPGAEQAQPQPAQPKPAQPEKRRVPELGKLGIPLRLGQQPNPNAKRAERVPRQPQAPQAQEGGDQALLDKNLPLGSENLLNTQESIYYSFYARLYEAIGPVWQSHIRQVPYRRRVQQGEYTTVVDVVLDRSGNLLEIRQIQSSGIPEFDSAVQESWRKIRQFPNPPTGLLNGQGEVHTGWTFTVNVGPGFNLEYLPPERAY